MIKIKYLILKISSFFISDLIFTNVIFFFNCLRFKKPYYFLNINIPKTFNEKINYIKFNVKNDLSVLVADKLLVRNFVSARIGSSYLIPLIAVFNSAEEIQYNILPKSFVMKLNNGSGFNLICKNKEEISNFKIFSYFDSIFNLNPYFYSREWQYNIINNKILVEKYLGDNISDFKFFCFNGIPSFIQVDLDRFSNHKRNLYDTNWNIIDSEFIYKSYTETPLSKPICLDVMLNIARKLSDGFIFSRIDLYLIEDVVYFGEITLHPEGGMGPFDSKISDCKFGESLRLF